MMKVLAAEMSDPSRLRRGKQYAKDGSVLDIVIDPAPSRARSRARAPRPTSPSSPSHPATGCRCVAT
jgi:uncharacterized Zn finger protein